jgi:hypothetical protein
VLASAKLRLTRFLGPIAGKVVDQSATRASSVADLYNVLAQRIDDEHDRKRFLVEAPVPTAPSSPDGSADVGEPSGISDADIQALAVMLTTYLGPIAPVVTKRESRNCASLAELRDRLAGLIPAQQDRNAFLRRVTGA